MEEASGQTQFWWQRFSVLCWNTSIPPPPTWLSKSCGTLLRDFCKTLVLLVCFMLYRPGRFWGLSCKIPKIKSGIFSKSIQRSSFALTFTIYLIISYLTINKTLTAALYDNVLHLFATAKLSHIHRFYILFSESEGNEQKLIY